MIIAACAVHLHLPLCNSLKDKRGRLKPLLARLRKEFNVSVAEVGLQDVWRSAEIGVVVVSTDTRQAQSHLETLLRWIETNRPEVEIVNAPIELR